MGGNYRSVKVRIASIVNSEAEANPCIAHLKVTSSPFRSLNPPTRTKKK